MRREREWNCHLGQVGDLSCFGEEEDLRTWRCWCTELRLEDSPRILQNDIEKSLECATVTAVELKSV